MAHTEQRAAERVETIRLMRYGRSVYSYSWKGLKHRQDFDTEAVASLERGEESQQMTRICTIGVAKTLAFVIQVKGNDSNLFGCL